MRYTPEIREQIDRAIRDASLANLTEVGMIAYVKQKTDIQISRTQLFNRRRHLKAKSIRDWNAYRNTDYAYRMEHMDRIAEAKLVRDIAIEQILRYRGVENKFFYEQKSSYLLLDANKRLDELTARIPEIDTIGHSITNEMEQSIPELSESETTEVGNISQRKF